MKSEIIIPGHLEKELRTHLFQNELEQGAFLFADVSQSPAALTLSVVEAYLVPPEGWAVQHEVFLELKDEVRAMIMRMARTSGRALVECHSHPDSAEDVWFSPSDIKGISDFSRYAKWKLENLPYAALVWGEASLDAVVWQGDFTVAQPVHEVRITGEHTRVMRPPGTWFRRQRPYWRLGGSGR